MSTRCIVKTDTAREVLSEFCGTMLLTLFNIAGPLNVAISGISNAFLANVACAGGVFLGMATAMSNSGAHLNPIVTTSFASRGLFPWKKAPHYIIAQYLGAFVGAVITYMNFAEGINKFDGGVRVFGGSPNATGIFFATYPNAGVSIITCIFDTMLCSALLLYAICAITDEYNSRIPIYLWAPCVSFMVMIIISTLSYNCAVAMNPARDLAPRLFTVIAGYSFEGFLPHGGVFWVVATFVPHLGGLIGAQFYHFSISLQKPGEQDRIEEAADGKLMRSNTSE
ncbi:aquaporin-3-like [Varroa jacobsoni]|uniref:Aquaporin n=1 Tax=Varroa destructor TaxID=109461 RepID=A0A7M7J7J3_VARDE|nr:aquaporin-3-like [Varroa destructor]XP_022647734.1 aquaporin-3-like [Varroa destructor]XP_022703924.1 aquaporin-3-like [Varroa jacobsoni]XP_022703925.1 aquaporin-3-like [Varroa jacobsoni]